jgi:signal transduction histidine kinase
VRVDLESLRADSVVGDLPSFDYRVPGDMRAEAVVAELERRPELPGVMVEIDSSTVLVSRAAVHHLLSKGFGREIFLRRAIRTLYEAIGKQALRLPATTPIAEATGLALRRPLPDTYEPLLVEATAGARVLDVHVLLLAQSHLLTLANRLVAQKVDELEAANEALRHTQAALVQSEKLASLGQLAAGVAHEINNPVAFVGNNLVVLKREMDDLFELLRLYRDRLALADASAAQAARDVEQELDLAFVEDSYARQFDSSLEGLRRVTQIVRNLSDFARLNQSQFKSFDLNAAITSTLEMLVYEQKKRGIRVETRFGDLPAFEGDPGKTNQVLLNLILNAMQACRQDGLVEIATFVEAGEVCIEVRDDGCGIAPENKARIFDPFFTTKPVGQGTGLGLSISFGIVRDHGGTIDVESTVGKGSCFRVHLPLASVSRPSVEALGLPAPPGRPGTQSSQSVPASVRKIPAE